MTDLAAFNANRKALIDALPADVRGTLKRLQRKFNESNKRTHRLARKYKIDMIFHIHKHICPRRYRYWRRIKMYDQRAGYYVSLIERITPGISAMMKGPR